MGFLKVQFVAKYQKKLKGDPFETINNFRKKKQKLRSLKKSHSTQKFKRRDPLGFRTFGDKKNWKTSRTVKKKYKGDPIFRSGFVSYVKN